MSTPIYGKAVKKFTQAGIKGKWLLPIAPVGAIVSRTGTLTENVLGKAPGRYKPSNDTWTGLHGSLIVTGVSKAEFEEFADWPTGNVGIIGKAFPAIDNDAGSEKARLFVEEVMAEAFGKKAVYGERIRGTGPRRLYAFKAYDPEDRENVVRTRHLTYKLKGDGENVEHKLDVLGLGSQYVSTGIHPSGDKYDWNPDASFTDADFLRDVTEIENEDIARFIELFESALAAKGGEIVRASGGRSGGNEFDVHELTPVMDIDTVLEGLEQIPNTPDTFMHRDDFVHALSAIRSALGKDSFRREVEDDIYDWATEDESWCDGAYFEKVWRSLETVRTPQDSLDRLFRRNGVTHHVKEKFDDNAKKLGAEIRKKKSEKLTGRDGLLLDISKRYIFGRMSVRDGQSQYTMRDKWDVDHDWLMQPWWKFELAETDQLMLNRLQEEDAYNAGKTGMANFIRDMQAAHPENFYSREVKHPNYDRGEIVRETMPDGSTRQGVNMRYLSQTIRAARKPPVDARLAKEDVDHILDFVDRLFGTELAKYELDTLGYMAQTGDRPGSLLFIVGESGVGKSLWINLQSAMMDGAGPEQMGAVDGAKLHNDNARRFMFGRLEGCRILSIRELPEGANARDMANITATLKQMVDPGPEGDYVMVETKGKDQRPVQNFARVNISSNYANSIHVEAGDRRIFYVQAKITQEDRPPEEYYDRLLQIVRSPERLAAFWRYLLARDIDGYSRYTAPPVSVEKAERIIVENPNAIARHMAAAVAWVQGSDRIAFSTTELTELMSDCAEAEYITSSGDIDDRAEYSVTDKNGKGVPAIMSALRSIPKKSMMKLDRDMRYRGKRHPAVYVSAVHARMYNELMQMPLPDLLDYVSEEYDRGMPKHPMPHFRK